ncbi:hypothetical protein [Legionella gresilensis]|uniref:hypothetical protein n=1 Tax=Legionella gresilensis TaxID=91823 RepID=UPI0010417565|nr:hypothetical protein [Legionella gresilensis]
MTKYLDVFTSAYSDYAAQFKKRGRSLSWYVFTQGDSFSLEIENLFRSLRHTQEEDQKLLFQSYLNSFQNKFNEQSFKNYLLKYLIKKFPNDGWENYYPKGKPVKLDIEDTSPYYISEQVILTGSPSTASLIQKTNSLILTSDELFKILRCSAKRELYEFILNASGDPKDVSFNAAVKALKILTGKQVQKPLTKEEFSVLFRDKLDKIISKFPSEDTEIIYQNTYLIKLKNSYYFSIVRKIYNFISETTDYKRKKLYDLLDKILEYEKSDGLAFEQLVEIRKTCKTLLDDQEFTYKQVTFRGLFATSRSKAVVVELSTMLDKTLYVPAQQRTLY